MDLSGERRGTQGILRSGGASLGLNSSVPFPDFLMAGFLLLGPATSPYSVCFSWNFSPKCARWRNPNQKDPLTLDPDWLSHI